MKKHVKKILLATMAIVTIFTFSSCSDDDEDGENVRGNIWVEIAKIDIGKKELYYPVYVLVSGGGDIVPDDVRKIGIEYGTSKSNMKMKSYDSGKTVTKRKVLLDENTTWYIKAVMETSKGRVESGIQSLKTPKK